MRVSSLGSIRQSDEIEEFIYSIGESVNLGRLGNDGGYRHPGIEGGIGVLKDHLHPAGEEFGLLLRFKPNFARCGRDES